METEEKKLFGKKGMIIFLIWFVVSLVGTIACSSVGLGFMVAVFLGQYVLGFGVVAVLANKPKRVQTKSEKFSGAEGKLKFTTTFWVGVLLIIVGAIIVCGGLISKFGNGNLNGLAQKISPVFIPSIFSIVGLFNIGHVFYRLWYRNKYMTDTVMATVIDIDTHVNHTQNGSTRVYAPIWEYDYCGEHFVQKQEVYTSRCKCIVGDVMEIRLNPEIPTEIYTPNESPLHGLIFGLVFLGIGVIAFYGIFKTMGIL